MTTESRTEREVVSHLLAAIFAEPEAPSESETNSLSKIVL